MILVMGLIIPLSLGLLSSGAIAFVYKHSNFSMVSLATYFLGGLLLVTETGANPCHDVGGGTNSDSRRGGLHQDPRHPLACRHRVPALTVIRTYIHNTHVIRTYIQISSFKRSCVRR